MNIRCNNCFREYNAEFGLCPYCGYVKGEDAAEAFCLNPGTEIQHRYIVGEMLGLGGFGITYKAWDKKLNIIVAIKEYYQSSLVNRQPGETEVILVATKREREFIYGKTRFLEEARNMAKFNTHPNVVNVFEFFETNNTAYIVMEYLEGKTVFQTIQSQNVPLPYDYCTRIAVEICNALRAIHKEGILHRDISPDNIMLCNNGNIKLFDFGAARFSAGIDSRVSVVVKPGFAPPEQYDSVNRQDPRTDIYALGATLYYALTREKPEESTNRKINDTLEEPSKIETGIPQHISDVVMRAMAIEQQYRYANADEFERALLNDKKVISVQKEKARKRRKRVLGICASLLVIFVVAGSALFYLNKQKSDATLPDATILVQYIQSGNQTSDDAKLSALHSIADTFTKQHSNVDIRFEARTIGSELSNEGREGVCYIIETTGLHDVSEYNFMSIEYDINDDLLIPQFLLNEYQYPTGIVVPIIFVNSSMGELATSDSFGTILSTCMDAGEYLVVSPESLGMFATLYGDDVASYLVADAKEDFLNRNAFIFFGNSEDYIEIQEAMPGEYSIISPACGKSTFTLGGLWSATQVEGSESETVSAFVKYLSSKLAQDYFHNQTWKSGQLPVLKSSLPIYFNDVFSELSDIASFLELPFAVPLDDTSIIIQNADPSLLIELKENKVLSTFKDISEGEWYTSAVVAACIQGLMEGTTSTMFAPNEPITKMAAIQALYRMAGKPDTEADIPFADVEKTSVDAKAVAWALENGIISSSNNLFNGLNPLDLQTTLVLIYRYALQTGFDQSVSSLLDQFADGSSVGSWATDGVLWAIDHGIISVANGGNISPQSEVSRARFAVMLDRLIDLENAVA